MTVLSPRLSESNSGCVFIRDLGYNPFVNSRKRIGQHWGPFGCKFPHVRTTRGPLWTTENRGYYPGRKKHGIIAAGQLWEKNWLLVFPSSQFLSKTSLGIPFLYCLLSTTVKITHRAFFLRRFWSVSRASLWRKSSWSFARPLLLSTKSRLNNNFALLMSFTGKKLILPLNVTLLNCKRAILSMKLSAVQF